MEGESGAGRLVSGSVCGARRWDGLRPWCGRTLGEDGWEAVRALGLVVPPGAAAVRSPWVGKSV